MAHDREVGGIRCSEVLEHLADYVDGEVDAALKTRLESHLRGCDWCEQFGGSYAGMVTDLRGLLSAPTPMDGAVQDRLLTRLHDA